MKTIHLDLFPEGRKKSLTMSYDDGSIYDRKLVEIFNRYGIRGTFHLNSACFGLNNHYVQEDEVKNLYANHEVSVHTSTHPHLEFCTDDIVLTQVLDDRRKLEDLVHYPVRGMSYPFGTYDQRLINLLPHLGMEYSRTVKSHGNFSLPEDFLQWQPTCHHKDQLLKLAEEFLNRKESGQLSLFYVWGHSHEFKNDQNWELMEEFCKKIAGDNNIWYATNIEIVNYLKAQRCLKFSLSGHSVYNPTALKLWFRNGEDIVAIEPGQLLQI